MDKIAIPYEPDRCGSIHGHSKTHVYGFCSDYASTLVALSVQAPATTIEQIHYQIQGQDSNIYLVTAVEDGRNRTAYSRKCHFTVFKSALPDTNEVSLIMLNDTLKRPVKDHDWTHVAYRDDESFMNELFYRVREIVYVPLLKKWSSFLYRKGMTTTPGWSNKPLCGVFSKRPTPAWMTAGFSLGYIRNSREEWEKLITDGLKNKLIEL